MPYYHVRISQRSRPSRSEIKLDLSREKLQERVLNPYYLGHPITIGGKSIVPSSIERIEISSTEQDSTYLRPAAEQKERVGALEIPPIPVEWHIADMGQDVTDVFITGPPGSESDISQNTQEELRPAAGTRVVFVVHGRNFNARDALFQFLRTIDLHPLEWSEAVAATGKASPYIGEILDAAFSRAHAVVALLTPDDEARLRESLRAEGDPPHDTQLTGQARPNVLFEAGMAMAGNQDRTILVELGTLRPFSDVAGRHAIRLDDSSQRRQELAQRLKVAGCPVNLEGTDWHTAGDFSAAIQLASEESKSTLNNEKNDESIEDESPLSADAKELLIESARDRAGSIMVIRLMHGIAIQTNRIQFGKTGDRRSEARWEQAIVELLGQELIQDPNGSGKHFEVTHKGFQAADQFTVQE